MLIYEVNLEVEDDINFKMAGWLPSHIDEMLKFKGFQSAHWYFRKPEDEGSENTNKTLWSIHYLVEDRKSLDNYFDNHAEKMRKEGIEKFGNKFSASRRVLNLLSVAGYPFQNQSDQPGV